MYKKLIKLGLLFAALSLSTQIAYALSPPSFSLSPSSGSYYVGCNIIQTAILIHTNNTYSNAANVIIGYDPDYLEVVDMNSGVAGKQIQAGSAYANYTGNTVNESTGEIRLTGYNASAPFYNSGSNFGTFGTIYFNVLQAGNASLTINYTPGSTTDSNIANLQSNDILNDTGNATYTLQNDTTDPYLSSYSPASGATGVAVSSNVTFRVLDDGCGVDINDVSAQVDGVTYTKTEGSTFSYSGSSSNYLITVNPSQNFDFNETVSVQLHGEDVNGNDVTGSYNFTTIGDSDPPIVSNRNPAADATNVTKTSNINFTISDYGSGINLNNLIVNVEGTNYTYNGTNQYSYSGSPSSYYITVNPSGDFERSQEINVTIDAKDNLGNEMTQVSYKFNIVPNIAPVVTEIADKTVNAGDMVVFNVNASDADGDTVTISMGSTTLSTSATYNVIDSTQGIFAWPTAQTDGGTYSVTFTATDSGPGNVSDTEVVSITVNEGTQGQNTAPTITNMTNMRLYYGDIITLLVHASDTENDTITLTATALPQTAITLTNISNGLAALTIDTTKLSSNNNVITITATDNGEGTLSAQKTFNIQIEPIPTTTCSNAVCPTCSCTCPTNTCPTLTCPEQKACTADTEYKLKYLEIYQKLKDYQSSQPEQEEELHKIGDLVEAEETLNELMISLPDEIEGVEVRETQEELEKLICPAQKTRYVPIEVKSEESKELVAKITTDIHNFGKKKLEFKEGINQAPQIVEILPRNNAEEVALYQPIVVLIADDKGIDTKTLEFKVNNNFVYYEIEQKNDKGYPEYKLTYIPKDPYPDNAKNVINLKVKESSGENPTTKDFIIYFNTGSSGITDESMETVKIDIKPEDLGLGIESVSVEINHSARKATVTGKVSKPSEVYAKWYGRDDEVTVSKYIKGNKFSLESPMEFPDGDYFVEVYADSGYGVATEPMKIKFKMNKLYAAAQDTGHGTIQNIFISEGKHIIEISAILVFLIILGISIYLTKE